MEESRKLTPNELLEAEAFFNLATMLGKCIQAAVFQMDHPEYDPDISHREDNPAAAESKPVSDKNPDKRDEPNSHPMKPGPVIHSGEKNIDTQIVQIALLIHDERLAELIGTCALYPMLRLAATQFGLNPDDPSSDLSPVDMKKAAIAWVIVKRVFAVRHPDETLRILNLPDQVRGDIFYGSPPPSFRPIDDADAEMIVETCGLFASDLDNDPDSQAEFFAEKLAQLRHDNKGLIPSSLAFWRQNEAAALGFKKSGEAKKLKIPGVYPKPKSVDVFVQAYNLSGEPLVLTGFDKILQATIGRLIQNNNGNPVTINASKLYRECALLDSGASVSEASIQTVIDSIERQRKAWGAVFYGDQLDAFLKSAKEEDKQPDFDYTLRSIDGNLISADRERSVHISSNGRAVDCVYTFHSVPILYRYSKGFKQLIETESKYISGALNKCTPENLSFAYYITTQINRLVKERDDSKSKSHSGKLTFETIADRSIYDISSRQKLRNFQTKVFNYCENLVSEGCIKSVDRYYKGKQYTGIIITV